MVSVVMKSEKMTVGMHRRTVLQCPVVSVT
jgi:hypothetical protein